jgi:creatinine amidohydrolase
MTTRWIHEMTWDRIAAHLATGDAVLVPIGATEQHGHHAPLMLDTGWAIGACEAAAAACGCLIAPPLHYGWSTGHMAFPGTIGLTAATLTEALVEIGECLVIHGFQRIILVNGNRMANLAPMEIAATRLKLATGAFTAVADCGLIAKGAIAALAMGPPGTLGHAGESETSAALATTPHLVDMAQLPPPMTPTALAPMTPTAHAALRETHHTLDPRLEGDGCFVPRDPAAFRRATEARLGVVGEPIGANAEQGRAMLAAIGARIAELVVRARRETLEITRPRIRG